MGNICSAGYRLSLDDGNAWWIAGDRSSICWIDEFAAIMGLKEYPTNGSPKLIFSISEGVDSIKSALGRANPSRWCDDARWIGYDYKTIRLWCHGGIHDFICEVKDSNHHGAEYMSMRCSLHPIYQESIYRGGLPIHAALIELDGRGILLAANSGTGKSTCCRRLPNHWKVLCDDESLITLNQQRKYQVHPLPTWSDYIWKRTEKNRDTQYSVPLSGVFFLEQSESDEAVPIEQWEAALLINGSAIQLYWRYLSRLELGPQRELKGKLLTNACAIVNAIPAFRLRVSLQGQFWKNIEDAICP